MVLIYLTDHPDAITPVKMFDAIPDPERVEAADELTAAVALLERLDPQAFEHFRRFELPRLLARPDAVVPAVCCHRTGELRVIEDGPALHPHAG